MNERMNVNENITYLAEVIINSHLKAVVLKDNWRRFMPKNHACRNTFEDTGKIWGTFYWMWCIHCCWKEMGYPILFSV